MIVKVGDEGQNQQLTHVITPFKVPILAECLASGTAVQTNRTAMCGSQKLLMLRNTMSEFSLPMCMSFDSC